MDSEIQPAGNSVRYFIPMLLIAEKPLRSTVAEMVGKRHDHLLRDIQGYIKVLLTNPKLGALDFFIKDSYLDKKGEQRDCYLLTKKGCDMVANKLTGTKGILFTDRN